MVYYTNLLMTTGITRTEMARKVIDSFEKHRFKFNKIKTLNTKWVFESFYRASVKLIFDKKERTRVSRSRKAARKAKKHGKKLTNSNIRHLRQQFVSMALLSSA